jgi:putative transposase
LRHTSPAWVEGGATHFITICAAIRARHILNKSEVAQQLLASARSYHPDKWWCRIWLIMPDHVHGLVSIPNGESLAKTVGDWKRFTAKAAVIQWQENFFDHRLRRSESLDEKAAYIRANPVRAGLVRHEGEWPWVWVPENLLATPQ